MDAFSDPQYKTADGSMLRLWQDSAINKFQTEKNGRPIHDTVIYVEVISPGSRDSTPVFELERTFCSEAGISEPMRGPKYAEYADFVDKFKKGEEVEKSQSGTPLSEWSELSKGRVADLRAQNFFTVDQIAAMPDTAFIAVGPDARALREKAQAYITAAKDTSVATALAAENLQLKQDMAGQADQIAALAAQISALQAGKADPTAKATKAAVTQAADPLAAKVDPFTGGI